MNSLKLSRKSLSDQVVERIEQDIVRGGYKPGTKLPTENEMVEKFQVSRITIREALKKLSLMGIVEIRQGDGTFVKKISPESFMKPLLPMLLLEKKDLYDISVARVAIEVKTAELAVDNATENDIDYLQQLVDKMELHLQKKEFEEYNTNDLLFHLGIARCAGNAILYRILEILQDLIKYEINVVSIAPLANDKSITRHKEILQAIRDKDVQMAKQAMYEHINDAVEYIRDLQS